MISHEALVRYIDSLAHKNSEALSWLPLQAYELAAAEGRIVLQLENDEPCGYLLHGPLRPLAPCTVWQLCIQTDARRRGSAVEAVEKLGADAAAAGCSDLRLRCASDLDANEFWTAAGFTQFATVEGGARRARTLEKYVKALESPQLAFWPPGV